MNQLGFKILIEFSAQISDIDVDNIGTSVIVIIPDMLFNLFAGKYNSLVQYQITKSGKLCENPDKR